jgi:CRP-like cAMP-binding protein
MFEVFINYITNQVELSDEEIEMVRKAHIYRKIKKRQFLLHEGEICKYSCFVIKGCLRSYRISDDGNEHILRFAVENWWVNDNESYRTGKPAKSNIDALEDSEVILISKQDLELLLIKIPNLQQLIDKLQARSYDASQNRIYLNISSTAVEKYQHFTKTYPTLLARLPLRTIAAYLGVSRETLSRIRK